MRKIVNRQDCDFVYDKPIEDDADSGGATLLVFHQGEMGFASFIAGMGLIGEGKPVCKMFSKLHKVGAFNQAPEPTYPEWRLFETYNVDGRRFFILRITHACPLPDSENGDHVWLYTYPIVRDIVMELNQYGVNEMIYLTSNMLESVGSFAPDEYITVGSDDVALFDYVNHEDDITTMSGETSLGRQIILAAPSWPFASIFKNFCTNDIRGVWIAIGSKTQGDFIDTDTGYSLLRYCKDVLGLNYSKSKVEEYIGVLRDYEHMTAPFNLDRAMADHDSGMHG